MNWSDIDRQIEKLPKTMNIYAQKGDKVVFLNDNGHDWEPEHARKVGLKEGGVYTVECTEVGGCHTDVYLREFPGFGFNSVMFRDLKVEVGGTKS
ncbi:hypothetical protein [Paenibacillus tyrfis]|uniref:hypothetical protein n=1 Tax=Paenibacillus tyrfis TaxID=1501230 RepID=UPI00209E14D6|nr:hypothetical protein [Paenibacillus tyrfis]MCP1306441.1 hypothetical protein [Paenibacillus tyrfis]